MRTHPRLWLHGKTSGIVRKVSLVLLQSIMFRLLREARMNSSLMEVAPAVTAPQPPALGMCRLRRALPEHRYTFPRYLHLSR